MKKLYWMKKKQFNNIVGIAAACFSFTAGCGEPNIQSMRPTVNKLATEIILVNQQGNWNSKDITNLASQAGVDALVVQTDGTQAVHTVDNVVKNGHVGLCVVVFAGAVPPDMAAYPAEYPSMKFEFVSDGSNLVQGQNVRNIYLNKDWIGYCVGYSAGLLANQTGAQNIGWIDGSLPSTAKKSELFAMLSGAYASNPKVTFVQTTIGTQGVIIPHLIVTNRILTDSELAAVSQAGSLILSLVSMQGNQLFQVWPASVQESAVTQDITSYSNSVWQPGNHPIGQTPMITMNAQMVSQSISGVIANQESVLLSSPGTIQSSLQSVPDAVKASWNGIVSTGS